MQDENKEKQKQLPRWPDQFEFGWRHMSLSLRSLVLWEILTGRQKFALPEELRQLPVRELPAYLNGFDGKVTLTLRSLHSPDAMRRMQEVEALKEDFLRRGASAEIMHWLFRLSKRQVQQMRRQFGLRNVVSGRPRRLGRDQEYEIFASWEKMRDQGMSYPQIMLNLSEQYPDVSMVSLYAVIKRMI